MTTETTLLGTDGQGNTAADTGQQTSTETAAAPAAGANTETNTPPAEGQPAATTEAPKAEGEAAPKATAEGEAKEGEKQPEGNPFHGAPEGDYEDITAPEGEQYDQAIVTNVKTLAKELGLNNDGAKKLTGEAHKIAKALGNAQVEALNQARSEWREQLKADKDIGGKNLEANLALAAKARQTFGDDDLLQVINESGLGDHPAVIRAFVKIGKALSDDTVIVGKTAGSHDQRSVAERLWPNQPKQ